MSRQIDKKRFESKLSNLVFLSFHFCENKDVFLAVPRFFFFFFTPAH